MTVSARQAQNTDRAADVVGVRQRHDPMIQIIPVTVFAPQEQFTDGVVGYPSCATKSKFTQCKFLTKRTVIMQRQVSRLLRSRRCS